MTWLAWAVDDPAPPANAGYSFLNVPREIDKTLRRGLVIHSVEGWFTFVNPSAFMAANGNSWAVTIMRDGTVWRHRPRPTWVNWHAGGPAQNIGTDGIEIEGKDQPWTAAQQVSLLRVLIETQEWFNWPEYVMGMQTNRSQEAIRLALLAAAPAAWLGEHTWVSNTSCPNGRDDWGWLLPALETEDDMKTNAELEAMIAKLREDATNGDSELRANLAKLRSDATGADNDIRERLDALEGSPGSYTDAQAVKAVRDAL